MKWKIFEIEITFAAAMIDDVKYEWNVVNTPNFIKEGKKVASIAGGRDSKTFRLTEVCDA